MPVILTGDLNCAHEEIDIFNPAVSDPDSHVVYESPIPPCLVLIPWKMDADQENIPKTL